jgi:uncharacterized protein (TIGR03083 family)
VESQLRVLQASVERLHQLVEPLDERQLDAPAYPSEWSIADVMSHIGSGAVIMQRRVDDGLSGRDLADDFAPSVWDEWNAKSPMQKAVDGLVADRELVARFSALTDDQRDGLVLNMGPLRLSAFDLVSMRLNEHTLHTWDIEVALDPQATLPDDEVALVIDNLELIGRFTARPDGGDPQRVAVHTTAPEREFTIDIGTDSVTFSPGSDAGGGSGASGASGAPTTIELPAEAFIRLVYGRLDPDHTPPLDADAAVIERLRRVFPGP